MRRLKSSVNAYSIIILVFLPHRATSVREALDADLLVDLGDGFVSDTDTVVASDTAESDSDAFRMGARSTLMIHSQKLASISRRGLAAVSYFVAQANSVFGSLLASEYRGLSSTAGHWYSSLILHNQSLGNTNSHMYFGLGGDCIESAEGFRLGCYRVGFCKCGILEQCYPMQKKDDLKARENTDDVGVCSASMPVLVATSVTLLCAVMLFIILFRLLLQWWARASELDAARRARLSIADLSFSQDDNVVQTEVLAELPVQDALVS